MGSLGRAHAREALAVGEEAVRWLALAVLLLPAIVLASSPYDAGGIALRSGVVLGPAYGEVPAAGGAALLKFRGPVGPAARKAAGDRGIRLASPIGSDGYIAWLPAGGLARADDLAGLAWAAPYHPDLRMAPEIAAVTADDPRPLIPIIVHVFAHADVAAVAERLDGMGLRVRGVSAGAPPRGRMGERAGRIVATPTPAQLVAARARVAGRPETMWIGLRPVYRLLNDQTAWVLQSGLNGGRTTPIHDRAIFGEGQVIAILDTGFDADMCFFRDPARGLPPVAKGFSAGAPDPAQRKILIVDFLHDAEDPANPMDWDTNGHGTHVAGIAVGDNFATPGRRDPGDGIAPAAKLVAQDGGYAVDDCADLPAIGCPAADLTPFFEQAYLQGARIHSNSWGDRENLLPPNIYSAGCEDADAFMWEHPEFLIVFAAGNEGPGPDTVITPSTAKDVLAVGATGSGTRADRLASFSSWGHAADGRIKPDVMAPGLGIISAGSDGTIGTMNCTTGSLSGTSMACPAAAGSAALIREYFEKGFYPRGAADAADGFTPSAALLKAALIASAASMSGIASPPPSREQGWGRILLDDVLFFAGDRKGLLVADAADRFGSPDDRADRHNILVTAGDEPLRIVLVWTDYPSSVAAATNLVNDLDLVAESPGGALYLGNVFAAGRSIEGGAADRLNTVEAIRIEEPETGLWTVTVRPFAIPQPPQGYALVVTGRVSRARPFIRGDVNEDGSLDLGDAVFALSFLFASGPSPGCMDAVDINDDGILDLGDPIHELNYLFASGSAPPVPLSACGLDPTADALDCAAHGACR